MFSNLKTSSIDQAGAVFQLMKQWTESKKEMLFLDVFGMSLPAWWHIAIVVDRHPAWILLVHIQLFPAIDLIWSDPRTQKLTAEEVLSLSSWRWRKRRELNKFPSMQRYHHIKVFHYLWCTFYYFHAHACKQTDQRTDGRTNEHTVLRVDGIGFGFQHHSMDSPPRRWEWRWKWTIFLHLNGNSKETAQKIHKYNNWPRPWRWVKWRTFLVMGIFQRERLNPDSHTSGNVQYENGKIHENDTVQLPSCGTLWHPVSSPSGRFWIQASLPLLLHQTHLSQKWVGCPCGHLRCFRCR